MFETESGVKKKTIYSLALVVVLLVVLGALSYPYIRNKFFKSGVVPIKTPIVSSELPGKFPANLPLTKASVVVHNFESSLPDGTTQSVRKWQSVETPAHVRASYADYFATNGWAVTTSVSQPTLEVLAAHKDGLFMSVSIRKAPEDNGSLIEVVVK